MSKSMLSSLALAAAATLALASCGNSDSTSTGSSETGSSSSDKKLSASVSIYPMQYLVQKVGGDHVEVRNLAEKALDAHDVEISPREVAEVTKDDVMFYIGGGFQPSVEEVAEGDAKKVAMDLADAADLSLKAGDTTSLDDEEEHEHEHGEEHKDEHGDEHEHEEEHKDEHDDEHKDEHEHGHHHDHDPNQADPHFWHDLNRMDKVAKAVAKKLGELDPDHAEDFTKNAESLHEDFMALDKKFETTLKDCKSDTFVTAHTAFAYLAKRYDLKQIGINGLSPADRPSPKTLTKLTEYIKEHKIPTIYYEVKAEPGVAKVVADETGANASFLDPLAGLSEQSPADDYMGIMEFNLGQLKKGQDCS